jgi:DNA-binding XRE family transcriptional regulator
MASTLDQYIQELKERSPREREKLERAERSFDLIGQLLMLRLEAGLTQTELAKRSGIRQSEISKIENGRINPTMETLEALGEALGVQLAFVPVHAAPSVSPAMA